MSRPAGVYPDLGALAGVDRLTQIAGALLTFTLVVAVLMLLISAVAWAIATGTGNAPGAAKARAGLLVALGAAILAGAGAAWINWLIDVGASV